MEKIELIDGGYRVISGSGGVFGGGKSTPTEAEDTLRSRAKLNALFLLGEGEIEGAPSGDILKDLYFDSTPVKNPNGSLNFKNFTVEYRSGTQAQSRIKKLNQTIDTETEVNVEVKAGNPQIRTLTQPSADQARIRVFVPRLVQQDSKGNLNGGEVKFSIEVSNNGGSYVHVSGSPFTIKGKTTSGYQHTYEFDIPSSGPWNFKITRISPDSESKYERDLVWQSYTAVIEEKLRYPNSALLGILIDAEQFSNVPEVAVKLKLLKVQIPNNYNPTTRVYTGVWNGGFVNAWTDNPAWILYDMLTKKRYEAGTRIAAANIDKWSFYALGQYCDELVPIGSGKLEPRFTCNVYIQERTRAYELLNSLASVFRGMLFWSSGSVFVGADKPTPPSRLFNESNVVEEVDEGGRVTKPAFNYQGTGLKARHSVALVSWSDPKDSYKTKVEYVEDTDSISKYGYRPTEITAFGCTSRTQAKRVGRWALISERLETQTVEFNPTTYGSQLLPGDVVKIADPLKSGERRGGRIESSTTTTINLDQQFEIEDGKVYTISVLKADGSIESRVVSNAAGLYTQITVGSAFSAAPVGIWVIEDSSLVPQQFKILTVSEDENQVYSVLATQYNESKYAYVDRDEEVEELPISSLENPLFVQPPQALNIEENLYSTIDSAGVKVRLDIGWQPSLSVSAYLYHVEVQKDGGGYQRLISTSDLTAEMLDVAPGAYDVRVQAVNRLGAVSEFAMISKQVFGLTAAPSNVTGFYLNSVDTMCTLNWDVHPDLDVLIGGKFVIRHTPKLTDTKWSDGLIIGSVSGNSTQAQVPLLAGTYMIKAVDGSGNESLGEASVSTTVPTVNEYNFIQEIVESPTFAGTKTSTEVISGYLTLVKAAKFDDQAGLFDDYAGLFDNAGLGGDVADEGYYEFSNTVDLGEVFSSRVTANLTAEVAEVSTLFDETPGLFDDNTAYFDGGDSSKAFASILISTSLDNVTFDDFHPFYVGDYIARAYKFKAKLESLENTVNIRVTELKIRVDMPDRVESDSVTTLTGGGTSISFVNPFRVTPELGFTIRNTTQGDYVVVTAKSATGFTIEARNAANALVARNVDWIAKAFGRRQ